MYNNGYCTCDCQMCPDLYGLFHSPACVQTDNHGGFVPYSQSHNIGCHFLCCPDKI
nr:MAG TPA: hypothetical protein [Caudoviricetes sp.]